MEVTIVKKPWGHEEIWAKTDKYVGKILHILDGNRLSLQYHVKKEETIRVLSGLLTFTLDDSTILMKEGDVAHVEPGKIHRMAACHGDVTVVEVSTTELDDVVRIEDDYKRT